MPTQLHPNLIELVYDAAWKSFWRKEALRKFVRECGIKESFISTWSSDESKRDFLDRLFRHLQNSDNGRGAILRMARFLASKKDFPDLEGWEESPHKLRTAKEATNRLSKYLAEEAERAREENELIQARQRINETRVKETTSSHTLENLTTRLNGLCQQMGSPQAGYQFETWFFDFLHYGEITHRRPYVTDGRQVDGAFTLTGTTYLVELKFRNGPADAPDVDSIFKKVTKTADNTMAVVVSISGYTRTAVNEASGSRTPLLLLDAGHLYRVLTGASTFADVVDRVRRHASQTGSAYLPVSEF